jgi:1-aminocyclopropane-1-carboxylate deaminase/D-cysteine desulfhydrase-like pyridoxal-dependent ACC family enzyme
MALQERAHSASTTPDALRETIAKLPRVRFAHLPTPLEEMPRLREELGEKAPRLFVKRDDLTGLAFGGNKVRHMEFRLADVLAKGCDTIIVANVAQSNHARLHTALAARFGLTTYILKPPSKKDNPANGNLLLDHIMGARIVEASSADPEVLDRELAELVAKLESEGRKVYNAVTDTFSKVAGTCGYLLAAMELMEQLETHGTRVDHIFMAAGSSTAGFALANKLLGAGYTVHPVSVGGSKADIEEQVCRLGNGVAELLGIDVRLEPGDFAAHDEYVGERYGVPTAAGLEAMTLAGRREGLILDPVYTSKAFSAMIDHIRRGAIGPDETVVFVHSGGLPIVFAYSEEILEGIAPAY